MDAIQRKDTRYWRPSGKSLSGMTAKIRGDLEAGILKIPILKMKPVEYRAGFAKEVQKAIRELDSREKEEAHAREDTPERLDQTPRRQLRQRAGAQRTPGKRAQSVVDISSDSGSGPENLESKLKYHIKGDSEEVEELCWTTGEETRVIHRRRREPESTQWARGISVSHKRQKKQHSPDLNDTAGAGEDDDEDTWSF